MHMPAGAHGERNLPRCGEVPRDLPPSNWCGRELARYSASATVPKAGCEPATILVQVSSDPFSCTTKSDHPIDLLVQ